MVFYSIDRMSGDTTDSDERVTRPEPLVADVMGNLISGCRLARGQRVGEDAFRISFGHLLLALLLAFIVITCEQRLAAGSESHFWVWGFTNELAKLQLWLATLAIITWAIKQPGAFVRLTTALVYALIPVWLAAAALHHLTVALSIDINPTHARVMYYGLLTWQIAIFWCGLRLLEPAGISQTVGAAMLYCVALLAINDVVPDSSMFYRDVEAARRLDVESVYYRQAALLDRQLAVLAQEDPSAVDLYLVGFGAYAAQDVFMREVDHVRHIFEDELGLGRHAVSLVNNPSTVWELPLANRHNLATVFDRLGRIMDLDQDILVLFVTSHGNEDASVAVEFEPLAPNDIYAGDIRAAFDAAGIQWRIIVVSACFAGSFINELQSPNTVVITAAAEDRSSFGCSHENEWTYFGRAYFADALVEIREFIGAFEHAHTAVTKRENDEGRDASDPQISVGERIADHLRVSRPLQDR